MTHRPKDRALSFGACRRSAAGATVARLSDLIDHFARRPLLWDANYAVNVKGTMAMCQGVIPSMIARGGGSIVNVSSMAGLGANPGMPYPYVATKFALVGVTKMLALEFASQGIRANVVAPGAIATDMLMQAYEAIASANKITAEEAAKQENASIPLGRPADPCEIANAIVWLASPAAAYVTGVALPVAGGMSPGI